MVVSETAFLVDFLPVFRRSVTRTGDSRSTTSTTTATRSSRGRLP
jgi:hypothetical protein